MSFNDQVASLPSKSNEFSVFKDGVKSKWLTGDNAILFRILPAYDYNSKDAAGNINPAGWLPFRAPDDSLTAWGGLIKISRRIGHGRGKASMRKDFLSPRTFNTSEDTFCPVTTLYNTAAMTPEWQYLIDDVRDANKKQIEQAALNRPQDYLAINIVELSAALPEVIVGMLTKSALDGLLNPNKNGLACARANNCNDDMIRQNYLVKWSCGDLTDPTNGPVMFIMKEKDKGDFSSYRIGIATDNHNNIRRYPLGAEILARRYDLTDLHYTLHVPPDEETVNSLVRIFCMHSPSGHHEWELLKLAFGQYFKIPDAPMAPAASPTVQSGFGPSPAGGYPPNQLTPPPAVQQNQFGPPPVASQPPMMPATQMQPPSQFGPPQGQQPVTAATVPVAPGGVIPTPQGAFGPGQATPQAPTGMGPGQMMPATPQMMGPAQGPAQAMQGPVAPGDPVRPLDRAAFLEQVRQGRQAAAK